MSDNMKVGQMHRGETTQAVQTLLDTFSGADGGASFVVFCNFLREMDRRAVLGDESAMLIVAYVTGTARLIDLAMKGGK